MSDEQGASGVTVSQLRRMLETSKADDKAQAAAKRTKKARVAAELEVHEAMEGAKQKSIELDVGKPWGVVYFSPRQTIYADVYDEDAYAAWVRENHREQELVSEDPTPRRKPLNQLLRRALKTDGAQLPDGVQPSRSRFVYTKVKG